MKDLVLGKGLEKMAKKLKIEPVLSKELKMYCGNNRGKLVKGLDILYSPHTGIGKDGLHNRNSGLNQVLAKEMAEKDIIFGIDVSELLKLKGMKKAQVMGRIRQNIMLCRKYKVEMCIFSLASDQYGLRSESELLALCEVLGMAPGEARKAVKAVEKRIEYNNRKKSGKLIRKGVEIV